LRIKQINNKIKLPFFVVLLSIFITIKPELASASVFGVISDWFNSNKTEKKEIVKEYNSQNIPLLKAPINNNPVTAIGGGDIVVRNDSTVVAESGPAGGVTQFVDEANNGKISLYIVREGDNLSTIADAFDVSVNTIR
jgi:hypothetical protein